MWELVRQVPAPVPEVFVGTPSVPVRRCVVWSGVPPAVPALPAAGARIDGISLGTTVALATRGLPVLVESGAAYANGADLEVNATGRLITRTTGVLVARAAEAASAASEVRWVVLA